MSSAEPFLHMSLREAHQGDVAISALEWRRLFRFARNDIKGRAGTWVGPYMFRRLINYNFGNLRKTVAAVGMKIRSPGFKSGLVSPSAFIGVPWKMKKGVPSSAYFL